MEEGGLPSDEVWWGLGHICLPKDRATPEMLGTLSPAPKRPAPSRTQRSPGDALVHTTPGTLAPSLPRPRGAPPASHPGGDVDRVHALGQGALQVLQRVQALHLAAAAIDELPEGVLLEERLHVLQEEALTEQGQFWGVVDLWGQGEGVRCAAQPSPTHPHPG